VLRSLKAAIITKNALFRFHGHLKARQPGGRTILAEVPYFTPRWLILLLAAVTQE